MQIEIETPRYTPELEGFESLAHVRDAGQHLSYPVHVIAPLNAEMALIDRALAEAARAAHISKSPGLRMVHQAEDATKNAPPAYRQKSLKERLFRQRAA
ncbi:MAG: hypothetical protein WAO78_05955 [Roseovarius sp.]